MLVEVTAHGTADHGGSIEMSHLRVQQWGDGRVVRMELFPTDARDLAKARFDELASVTDVHALENQCTRVRRTYDDRYERRRWDELVTMFSERFVSEDRRLGLGDMHDRETQMEMLRVMADLGVDRTVGIAIATRGERLGLFRTEAFDANGETLAELLTLNELDDDGLFVRSVLFDPDDLDPAFAELEERFIAGEGKAFAPELQVFFGVSRAYNRRDWGSYRASLHDEFVQIDHRPAGAGHVTGPHDRLRYNQTLLDLAPDAQVFITAIIALRPGWALGRQRVIGTTQDGASIELSSLVLGGIRDGLNHRFEQFAVDDLETAVARFEELSSGQI
jgi:hypothetical protein